MSGCALVSREVNVGSEHKLVNVPAHVEPMSPVCGEGGGDVSRSQFCV